MNEICIIDYDDLQYFQRKLERVKDKQPAAQLKAVKQLKTMLDIYQIQLICNGRLI